MTVVWKSISVALKSKWDSKLSHSDVIHELLNINGEMEETARVTGDLEKLHMYLSKVSVTCIVLMVVDCYQLLAQQYFPSTLTQTFSQADLLIHPSKHYFMSNFSPDQPNKII